MDIDLDDLDLEDMDLFDEMPEFSDGEDVNAGDRNPLDSVKAAALEVATDPSTYANSARAIAKNALPEGYAEFGDGLVDIKDAVEDAVDVASKELESSGKVLRDIALKHEKLASKILPDDYIQKLKDDREIDKFKTPTQGDRDEAEMTAALGQIFKANENAQAQRDVAGREADAAIAETQLKVDGKQLDALGNLSAVMGRLVSFQDNITNEYYRKSLELEFKQYFALRDIRDTQIAYFKDSNTKFDALVKNTGLPDILKSKATEEYAQLTQERLLGSVNDTLSNKAQGYFGKVKDNLLGKVRGAATTARESIEMAGDILTMDAMDDLPQDVKDEMMASMALGQVIETGSGAIGARLANVAKKYPEIASVGLELLYLKDNSPMLFDDLIRNGDDSEVAQRLIDLKGKFNDRVKGVKESIGKASAKVTGAFTQYIPESVKEKFRDRKQTLTSERDAVFDKDDMFADVDLNKPKVSTDNFFVRFLKDIAPELGDNSLTFKSTLMDEAYQAVPLDLSMRTSIVDIIPGLLLENNKMMAELTGRSASDAKTFDRVTGLMTSQEQAKDSLSREFLESVGTANKQTRLDRIVAMIDPEKTLTDTEVREVKKVLLKQANGFSKSKVFSYQNLITDLNGSVAVKVADLLGMVEEKTSTEQAQYRNFFAREFNYLSDDFQKGQRRVYDAVTAGARQDLSEMDFFVPDEKDPSKQRLDFEAFADAILDYDKEAPRPGTRKSTGDASFTSPEADSAITGASDVFSHVVAINGKLPDLYNYEGIEALPVYVVNNTSADIAREVMQAKLDSNPGMSVEVANGEALDAAEFIMDSISESTNHISDLLKEQTKLLGEIASNGVVRQESDTRMADLVSGAFETMRSFKDEALAKKDAYVEAVKGVDINELLAKADDLTNSALKRAEDVSETIKSIDTSVMLDDALKTLEGLGEKASGKRKEVEGYISDLDLGTRLDEARADVEKRISELGLEEKTTGAREDLDKIIASLELEERANKTRKTIDDYVSSIEIGDRFSDIVPDKETLKGMARERFQQFGDYAKMAPSIMKDAGVAMEDMLGRPETAEARSEQMDYGSLKDVLFDRVGDHFMIPVYTPELPENEDDDAREMLNAIIELQKINQEGFTGAHGIMTAILESTEGLGEGEGVTSGTRSGVLGYIMGSLGDFAKGAGTGAGNFLQKYYTGLGNFFRGGGSAARNVMGGVGDFLFGKKGEDGEETGERTNPLMKLFEMGSGAVTSLFDAQRSFYDNALGVGKMVVGGVKAVNDKTESVYVGSEKHPRLLATILRRGGYYNDKGEPIYSHLEIDSDVYDADGEIILTMQEISSYGIFGKGGKDLSEGRLRELLKGAMSLGKDALSFGYDTIKAGVKTSYNVANRGINLIGDTLNTLLFGGKASGGLLGRDKVDGADYLEKIYLHMATKWPLSKDDIDNADEANGLGSDTETVRGLLKKQIKLMEEELAANEEKKDPEDADGDGLRDGSWMAKRKAKKEAQAKEKDTYKGKTRGKGDEDGGGNGMLMAALGAIASGIGNLGSTLASTLTTAMAAKGGMDAVSTAADVATSYPGSDKPGKPGNPNKPGKPGMLSKLWQGLKSGGKWALGAGSALLGSEALATGAAMAGRGLVAGAVMGAEAAAALFSWPVIAATIAGYGVYKAIDWAASRMDAEPYEFIRYAQYGIQAKDGGILRSLRLLEDYVIDDVEIVSGKVTYNRPTNEDLLDELTDIFGWGEPTPKEMKQILTWFHERFLPVLLWHTGAIASLDSSVDILDIDDEIEDEHRAPFLKAINVDNMMGYNPYSVTASPAPGLEIKSNRQEVRQLILKALKDAGEDVKLAGAKSDDPNYDDTPEEGVQKNYDDTHQSGGEDPMKVAAKARQAQAKAQESSKQSVGQAPNRYSNPNGYRRAAMSAGMDNSYETLPAETTHSAKPAQSLKPGSIIKLALPVSDKLRISSPYGIRVHPITKKVAEHKGVDFAGPRGEKVMAAANGAIIRIEYSNSYGNVIYLKHDNGWCTRYAHMDKFRSGLSLGDRVNKGDVIGYIGNTGKSKGNHLHWELRVNDDPWAHTLDPMPFVDTGMKPIVPTKPGSLKHAGKAGQVDMEKIAEAAKRMEDAGNPQVEPVVDGVGEEPPRKGVDGDVNIAAKGGIGTEIRADGEVIRIGYHPKKGRFIEVRQKDNKIAVYSGFEQMPLGIKQGTTVKKGTSLTSGTNYGVTMYSGATKASSATVPDAAAKAEAEAAVAKTNRPMLDKEDVVSDLVNAKRNMENKVHGGTTPVEEVNDKLQATSKPRVNRKPMAPAKPAAPDTEAITAASIRSATTAYQDKSTQQRDRQIDLLVEIRDMLSKGANVTPQQTAPQPQKATPAPVTAKRKEVNLPMTSPRPRLR